MELYEQIELQECPICGGAGLMEEENGWCFYAACLDCGAHTAHEVYYTMSAKRHGIIGHWGGSGPRPRIALAIRLV